MRVRRATVEHVFGALKAWMGKVHFKTRTLAGVCTEMSLHVLAHTLKRAIAILGVEPPHGGDASLILAAPSTVKPSQPTSVFSHSLGGNQTLGRP